MSEEFNKHPATIDLSDSRFLLVGIILLLIPILYIMFHVKKTEQQTVATRISVADPGKQSAFNLTSTSRPAAAARTKSLAPAVKPEENTIDAELERAWSKVQAIPKRYSLPPDTPPETRQMIEIEHDPHLSEANSLFDQGDMAAAEKAYEKALSNSDNNPVKELHAWGGLMEVYLLTEDKEKFRTAFKNYALAAQKLSSVYGPLADDVSRAYEMFAQISMIDPGKLREQLTKANLLLGSKVSFDDFINGLNQTKEWYPKDLPTAEPVSPYSMQRGGGG